MGVTLRQRFNLFPKKRKRRLVETHCGISQGEAGIVLLNNYRYTNGDHLQHEMKNGETAQINSENGSSIT